MSGGQEELDQPRIRRGSKEARDRKRPRARAAERRYRQARMPHAFDSEPLNHPNTDPQSQNADTGEHAAVQIDPDSQR